MALDRTAFNALVDDTGSSNGTIWNKAQIQNVVLDPVDAALPVGLGVWTPYTPTLTASAGTIVLNTNHRTGYTLLGAKTIIVSVYMQFTLSVAAASLIKIGLPVGRISLTYASGFWAGGSGVSGVIVLVPDDVVLNLARDTAGTGTTPTGVHTIAGFVIFELK